jgi:hypothetical protein
MLSPLQVFKGRQRLSVVFWLYLIIGGTMVVLAPELFAESLYGLGLPLWAFITYAILEGFYLLFVHFALWTCAFNTKYKILGYASRLYVCVVLVACAYWFFVPHTTSTPKTEVLEVLPPHVR